MIMEKYSNQKSDKDFAQKLSSITGNNFLDTIIKYALLIYLQLFNFFLTI